MTFRFPVAALALVIFSVSVHAQWPSGPPAGVAKKPGSLPAERAPVPRTAGGVPDLSGVWEPEKNRPCPPEGCRDLKTGEPLWDFQTEASKQNKGWILTADRKFNEPMFFTSSWREAPIVGIDRQQNIGGIFSTPLVMNGVVYFGSTDGNLYAID